MKIQDRTKVKVRKKLQIIKRYLVGKRGDAKPKDVSQSIPPLKKKINF
jgi:hypothetical protein